MKDRTKKYNQNQELEEKKVNEMKMKRWHEHSGVNVSRCKYKRVDGAWLE